MPAADDENDRQEVGGVAEHLVGELGQECSNTAAKIERRRAVGAGREEPDGIGRRVARQRNQPDQGQREEGDAHELADTAGNEGSHQVRSP